MPWFAGVDRSQVNWQPTIDPNRCIGCGICMNCGKKVFDWLPDEQEAVVARPLDCVVGCNTCANLCHGRAISFPEVKELLKFYARNHIWDRVKAALISEGKLFQPRSTVQTNIGSTCTCDSGTTLTAGSAADVNAIARRKV